MPDSLKWANYHQTGVVPFDLADMDFATAPEITRAVASRSSHGQFGYGAPPQILTDCVVRRMARLYQWKIHPDWIVWLPGTVAGLRVATMAFCGPTESVATFIPAYTPFLHIPQSFGRRLVSIPLQEGQWRIDFTKLEQVLTPETKLLLLCNPHNPTGGMWTKEEIHRLVRICVTRGITICSDEVHAELILDTTKNHIPTASISDVAANHTVTLMSASKTFNIAGMSCGFAIIPNDDLRKLFKQVRHATVPAVPTLGYTATLAAFTRGDVWKEGLLAYLRVNKQIVEDFCATYNLKIAKVDASYLAWINVRQWGADSFTERCRQHGLGICNGAEFGYPGYVRFNFACSRVRLEHGLSLFQSVLECEDQNCKAK